VTATQLTTNLMWF